MNNIYIPTTQLWVGADTTVNAEIVHYLQKLWCSKASGNPCIHCVACRQITQRQHHAVRWISPEKQQYIRADIEIVFKETVFALSAGSYFFFIITEADLLTDSCANSLLKVLEEPSSGYYFILTTERPDAVLSTIVSRCVTRVIEPTEKCSRTHTFMQICQRIDQISGTQFLKEFEKVKIQEQETRIILDRLLLQWQQEYQQAVSAHDDPAISRIKRLLGTIDLLYKKLPMPGSAKIFWRTFFLQVHHT